MNASPVDHIAGSTHARSLADALLTAFSSTPGFSLKDIHRPNVRAYVDRYMQTNNKARRTSRLATAIASEALHAIGMKMYTNPGQAKDPWKHLVQAASDLIHKDIFVREFTSSQGANMYRFASHEHANKKKGAPLYMGFDGNTFWYVKGFSNVVGHTTPSIRTSAYDPVLLASRSSPHLLPKPAAVGSQASSSNSNEDDALPVAAAAANDDDNDETLPEDMGPRRRAPAPRQEMEDGLDTGLMLLYSVGLGSVLSLAIRSFY
jgi:hypothetical protein